MSKEYTNFGFVVAENEEDARQKVIAQFPELKDKKFRLRQDEDCLDTWFSSWLWPLSVFDADAAGSEAAPNADLQYYYPTADLVTAPEILFFWVARMIAAGCEWGGGIPFGNVYLTGIVRDKLGRKMSKQLGNSPDPIALIEKYGADGVRLGMLLTSPAGNDLPFDEVQCEQGRNFCNKIWNSFRLINGWQVDKNAAQPLHSRFAFEWMQAVLQKTLEETNDDFNKYRLSEALMKIYKLYWDDFSGWYLETVKPLQGQSIDAQTYDATLGLFDTMLRLLHPFMPFITEELWQNLAERRSDESIMYAPQPNAGNYSKKTLQQFEFAQQVVTHIRSIRKEKNIAYREALQLFSPTQILPEQAAVVQRLANTETLTSNVHGEHCVAFMVRTTEFFVPLGSLLNVSQERKHIETELEYYRKFIAAAETKLANERFVASAPPHIVELERKKHSDAYSKIQSLEKRLESLAS